MKQLLNILILLVLSLSCGTDIQNTVTINEIFQTERDEPANIDSPAIWHGPNNEHWLIATAKGIDKLYISDAITGKPIKIFGVSGDSIGQLGYPNGISVFENYLFIVERDNQRVQVFSLPQLESIGFISDSMLVNPYGLFIYQESDNINHLYVTDNYLTKDDQIPPIEQLDQRIHHYTFTILDGQINSQLVNMFGETSKDGALYIVESIYGDPINNSILIAEEDTTRSAVNVYDFDGNYKNISFGQDIFKRQVEGIALYQTSETDGYWIITDQNHTENCFHIFTRMNFIHIGSFSGPKTTNTDGIWLTQESFGLFNNGAFYAVHNDGNVSAFDWQEVVTKLNLK